MPSTTSVLSAYTTFSASTMLARTMLNEVQNLTNQLIPQQLQEKVLAKLGGLIGYSSSQMTLVIDEYNGLSLNQMFEASEAYLRTKISPSVVRLKLSKAPQEQNFSLTVNKGEKIVDSFDDVQVVWQMICTETQKTKADCDGYFSSESVERRSVELSFHKKHKEKVLSSYLPHVLERSEAIKEENKVVKLHSLGNCYGEVNLDHPSTFDKLAMDPTLKQELMDDLDRFVKRRKFYKRVGKVWKRGYLLYGPPGTGKSSLIAAMANYLKFDIFDLELTSIHSNSDLRRLLLATTNRSILVIEDIDCSSDFQNRQAGAHNQGGNQLTLSGLLNFIDGLWSSCGDERIIVFTTNHKDRLDPALLRPGRMDMHIHMSYCTPSGFRILASNYLGVNDHSMFTDIEQLITEVDVTPAEIAEELMKSEDVDIALKGLVKYLHVKKIERGKANGGEKEVSEQEREPESKGRS
ncbi:P-loop containing nucleoside triphosphate hydrolases superfamily protein [Actinidia rufa]|uniref:P-loop containing nucleoside triphosphate hydrolases superfamily protein n=1 Tax=Actinidia rufa TaxID=165716 RepID=A0A7J0EYU3_9ERIC|nr:P-loop containing nucleoside triphosphate hydrolases superfamily protein [Actinidia rufa]